MNTPKVSVIIPVYNTAKYVAQAIESVTNQTLADIEIILIDDGSTDNSYNIISELGNKNPKIKIYRQENKGPSISRNAGLNKANGEYIYFMDSDDFIEPDTLELCYKKCTENQLDFVFFDAESFNDIDMKNTIWFSYKRTEGLTDKVYSGIEMFDYQIAQSKFQASVCLNFIRHEYLRNIDLKFYPDIIHEDQLFITLLYLQASRVGFINRCFFKRRIRQNSIMTTRFAWQNIKGYFIVAEELLIFGNSKTNEVKSIIHKYLKRTLNAAVWQAHILSLKERISIVLICRKKYSDIVSKQTIIALLFRKYKPFVKKAK